MLGLSFAKEIGRNVELLCIVVGALIALKCLVSLFLCISRALLKKPKNLPSRYGGGSWVLVTGASDGIGKAFCFAFAARGFNVCLVARNAEKLKAVCQEIKTSHPKIETKFVVADFGNCCDDKFFDNIMTQIDTLDISILVNNVGVGVVRRFGNFTEAELKDMTLINTVPMVLLTRKLINKLMKREHRSAVINVSSGSAITPLPYYATYGGSKKFNRYFSLSLEPEFRKRNIDVLCLMPFYVDTQMAKKLKGSKVTPEACVEGCLRDLGNTDVSFGATKHRWQGWISSLFASLPKPILDFYITKFFK